MARRARFTFTLQDGRTVGANFKVRGAFLAVQFPHPTEAGRYVELSTGVPVPKAFDPKKGPPPDWHTETAKLILKHYTPTLASDLKKAPWNSALAELEKTPGIRPATLADYKSVVSVLRETIPDTRGPGEITAEVAKRFKRVYSSTPFTRGKGAQAKAYTRSNNTVRAVLRKLSSLWSKHLAELGYVSSNPWESVTPPPQTKKAPAVPTDDLVEEFLGYLARRYPRWKSLRLWVELKALTASRTADLCQLRAGQLRDGRIFFAAHQTKGRADRSIPLPADLYRELEAIKGPTWLWEQYVADVAEFRPAKSGNPKAFDPANLYWTVNNIFKEFNRSRPGKPRLRPHDLRRRAITAMTVATQSVDATAQAIGVDPQTARRYYLDADRAFKSDELFTKLAGVLRPVAKAAPDTLA